MKYSLHPGAVEDLREAAKFYRERAGSGLSRSLVGEFERSVNILLRHPDVGTLWREGKRRFVMKRIPYSVIYLPVFGYLYGFRRRNSHPCRRPPQPPSRILEAP